MRITCNVVGSLNEVVMLVQNVKEWVLKRAGKEKERGSKFNLVAFLP